MPLSNRVVNIQGECVNALFIHAKFHIHSVTVDYTFKIVVNKWDLICEFVLPVSDLARSWSQWDVLQKTGTTFAHKECMITYTVKATPA